MRQGPRGKFGRPGGKLAQRIRAEGHSQTREFEMVCGQRECSVPKSKFKRNR